MVLLLTHAAVTWFLMGLIWIVQVVHYPLMAEVGAESYSAYQQGHMQRITWVVAPTMVLEALTALWIAVDPPMTTSAGQAWLGFGLVLGIWGATATLSVPAHGALLNGFDAQAHRRLVWSNWLRTLAWSARGALVALWLAGPMEVAG